MGSAARHQWITEGGAIYRPAIGMSSLSRTADRPLTIEELEAAVLALAALLTDSPTSAR